MYDDVMIRGFGSLDSHTAQKMAASNVGAPIGLMVGGVVPTAPQAQQPVSYYDQISQFAQENPLVAGGAILGGAYMAYKAGSLLGGLLAGGATLLYGSHILAGLTGQSPTAAPGSGIAVGPPQPGPVVQEPMQTDAELKAECAATGGQWTYRPLFCGAAFGPGMGSCPQYACEHTTPQQDQPNVESEWDITDVVDDFLKMQ